MLWREGLYSSYWQNHLAIILLSAHLRWVDDFWVDDSICIISTSAIQPTVKCRGPNYLRIVFDPEYSLPEHLERLRKRGLSTKRSLALREFTLGLEALERFVERATLRQGHECVFGVLALESEPVAPRL